MLYTITAASPEVEDFVAELQIESHATFEDLHRLIRSTCGWAGGKPSTFYICDHRWRRERAIPEKSREDDVMADVELGDLLDDEGQRMQYVFDPQERRGLLLEVTAIAYGRHIDAPTCRRRHGQAPPLTTADADTPNTSNTSDTSDLLAQLTAAALAIDDSDSHDTICDDSDFDPEELDPEGFDITEF
ncbi:MAG: hypothetical protein IJS59_05795 [Bacteroidaceae bacterium]|nr:hypothetical protein [Bacteroidaceae bacterium]